MNLGRVYRTVRHLSAEQWLFRFVCRGRFELGQRFPGRYRAYLERAAAALPLATPDSDALARAAQHVLVLQQAVHGDELDGIAQGRFHFLGRTADFGSFDAIDWRHDMPGERIPMWRLTLSYMGWMLCLLATGRRENLELAERAVRSMEAQNPLSVRAAYFDVWRPYSVSHRLINLLCGLALYRAAGGERDDRAERTILEHVRLCAAYLFHNLERDLQYNHLLKNFVALSVYRSALAQPGSRFDFLDREIPRSLRQQHLSDGGQAERAPMYHALYLLDLLVLGASGCALDAEIGEARAALGVMLHPDGDVALFNDSWLGESPPGTALGAIAPEGKALLPETGYARIGIDGDAVIFDCGACGPDSNPGHAHADFLSVEASVGGRRLLVDPGVPTYSPGALRDASRSSANHNGPHMRGWEPIEFWQSFRVGHRGYAYPLEDPALGGVAPLWCAGWHDGYRGKGAIVARWIGLWPGEAMLFIDQWHGAEPERAALRFLVPAEWRNAGDGGFQSGNDTVRLEVPVGTLLRIEPGEWAPRYNEIEPAHAVQVAPVVDADGARAATLWRWGGSGEVPHSKIQEVAARLRAHCERIAR